MENHVLDVMKKSVELTQRDLKIIKGVWNERPNDEIAEILGLGTPRTEKVKNALYDKLHVSSNFDLIKWAVKNALYKIK